MRLFFRPVRAESSSCQPTPATARTAPRGLTPLRPVVARALGLSLLCTSCAAGPPRPTSPEFWPPPLRAGGLEVSPAGRAQIDAFRQALAKAIASGDRAALPRLFRDPAPLEAWLATLGEGRLYATVEPLCSDDVGAWGHLNLRFSSSKQGVRVDPIDVAFRVDAGGAAWLDPPAPKRAPRLSAERARLEVQPVRRWLKADVVADVEAEGSRVVVFNFASNEGELRLVEVSQDGQPCRFRVLDATRLAVELARPGGRAGVRFRYEGTGPTNAPGFDYVQPDDLVLRHENLWLPRLGDDLPADYDVKIVHPADFELFGQGADLPPRRLPDGRVESGWRHRGSGFTLYGHRGYEKRDLRYPGVQVTLALFPEDASRFAPLQASVDAAFRAFAPLGPYPLPRLRIVESEFQGGYGALSNITLGRKVFEREGGVGELVAHEIAHGWFPGLLPAPPGQAQYGEALAEYLASWTFSEGAAVALRSELAKSYARVPEGLERPILDASDASVNPSAWATNFGVRYAKGSLVLAQLEAEIGRAGMARLLQTLIRERAGKPTGWPEVVETAGRVAGAQVAGRLRAWLSRKGAPDLGFAEVKVAGGRVRGKLTQTSDPPFDGIVAVGLGKKGETVRLVPVRLEGATTAFEFALPEGVDRLVLNADERLPSRSKPEQREVALP